MASIRRVLVAGAVVVLAACGGGTSDDPASTDSTISEGATTGLGRAIERAQEVADQAEERANQIDQLAP